MVAYEVMLWEVFAILRMDAEPNCVETIGFNVCRLFIVAGVSGRQNSSGLPRT